MVILIPNLINAEMRHFPGGFHVPEFWDGASSTILVSALLIDADGEKQALVIQAPKTGSIRKIGFMMRTITTGGELESRLETVDETTGFPTGNLYCLNSSTVTNISGTADNTWHTSPAFPADCAVNRGEFLAVVFRRNAGSTINAELGVNLDFGNSFNYRVSSNSASGYVKGATGVLVQIEYSDGNYYALLGNTPPYETATNTTFNDTSTPDEIGNRMRFSFSGIVTGFWSYIDFDGPTDIVFYDSDGATSLSTLSISSSTRVGVVSDNSQFVFPSTFTVNADTYYRIVAKPTSATSIVVSDVTADSAALMESFPYGSEIHYTSAKDPNEEADWTNNVTRRCVSLGLIFSAIDTNPKGHVIYKSTINKSEIR